MIPKELIQRVVNVFETGSPSGKYETLCIFNDGRNDTRQITYGRSQTTEQGNLKALVSLYCKSNGTYGQQLSSYLDAIGKKPLCDDESFKSLLVAAGKEDPIMRVAQDTFFDSHYWQPAEAWFNKNGFKLPLSMLVIYDSFVHSGSIRDDIRNAFPERPPVNGGTEKAWINAYVHARHHWLLNHRKEILHKTVYRTQLFITEIDRGNWNLDKLPINANGVKVS
jgi:chitosanase